jgi:hypothetical protein
MNGSRVVDTPLLVPNGWHSPDDGVRGTAALSRAGR